MLALEPKGSPLWRADQTIALGVAPLLCLNDVHP